MVHLCRKPVQSTNRVHSWRRFYIPELYCISSLLLRTKQKRLVQFTQLDDILKSMLVLELRTLGMVGDFIARAPILLMSDARINRGQRGA